eukprot:1481096-Pyramimonas_sp.AAC.1
MHLNLVYASHGSCFYLLSACVPLRGAFLLAAIANLIESQARTIAYSVASHRELPVCRYLILRSVHRCTPSSEACQLMMRLVRGVHCCQCQT